MHRSRSREKPRRASHSRHAAFTDGNVQSKRRIKVLRTEHDSNCECGLDEGANSITLEFKKNSSRKVIGMPIKALIDEEMSREKHIRRSSPSLIARLMGLDTLPSPGSFKTLKEVRSSSRTVLSKELHEQITTPEDCSPETSNVEHQEFKDVFEVVQAPKAEKQKEQIVQKGISSLRWYEMDKAFIRQSFVDATSLSSDEMLQRPEELVDAVDVLDSKKDIYLPFLQEPSKHLHDPRLSPSSPQASYPLILMEPKGSLSASCESSFRSERNVDRYTNSQRGASQSFWELAANLNSHPSKEHVCSLLQKLPEPTCIEKDECCAQPTQIVILKPSLDKALKAERNILSAKSLNNFQRHRINYGKFPIDKIPELYAEERARRKVHGTVEIIGHKIKGSRDIAKEVAKQMTNTLANERKKVSVSKLNDCEGSFITSSIKNWNSSQTSHCTSADPYDYINSSNLSSFCPMYSTVNREARKRLSERWKLTNHNQEMGLSNRGSSTLAEMLALSDNETSKITLNMSAVKKAPERKLSRDDLHEPKNHPLGISSKDGWKDGSYRSLPRSKSLPATSLVQENSHYNSRNRPGRVMLKKIAGMSNGMSPDENFIWQKNASLRNLTYSSNQDKLRSDGEEIALTEREIHVSSEELKKSNDVDHLSEKEHTSFELPKNSIAQRSDVANNLSISQSNTDKSSLIAKEKRFEKLQDSTESEINEKLLCDKHEFPSKEALVNRGSGELPAHSNNAALVCLENYKEADQPSPVSVLDLQFEEEEVTSGCFEKISADLQELRMQLRLLKQESIGSCAEDTEALISSDEDAGGEPFPQYADMLQAFRDEEDRDYSYVLDMLIDCGILKSELDGFFSACHSTEYPVGLPVFDELEKKYKSLDSWSRSERKLLFDLTNSILADIIMPFMNMPPWGKPKIFWQSKMVPDGLVEEVWQAVVKKMNNLSCSLVENPTGLRWLDIADGKELVGRQLQNMLQEDLVHDLVHELVIELNYSKIYSIKRSL